MPNEAQQNAVTAPAVEARIAHEEFINPAAVPHLTLCVLVLTNGFAIVGQSAPADPVNFDAAYGRPLARQDAVRQVWPFEGYLLRDKLAQTKTVG